MMAVTKLETTPPFQAKVDDVIIEKENEAISNRVVYICLSTKQFGRIGLGGENDSSPELVDFAETLQKGRTYEFPKQWLEFRASRRLKE